VEYGRNRDVSGRACGRKKNGLGRKVEEKWMGKEGSEEEIYI
jgi:hypothetical protein